MYKTLFFKNKILNIYINTITQCHTHYISLIYTCTCICVYRYAIGYCLGWVSAMEYPYVISVSVIYISYLMSRFESMMIPNGNSGNWAQHHATAQAPINAKTDPAEGQLENVFIDSAVRNRFCTSSLITDPRCLSLITDAFRLLAFYIFNFHNYDIIFFLICMMMMWVIWRLICEHCQHHIWDMFAYALVYVFLYVMNCVFMCLLDVWS